MVMESLHIRTSGRPAVWQTVGHRGSLMDVHRPENCTVTSRVAHFGASAGVLVIATCLVQPIRAIDDTGGGAASADTSYSTVAPPRALVVGVRMNLQVVADWLADGDYASAQETAKGVTLLAELVGRAGGGAAWRSKSTQLQKSMSATVDKLRAEDAAAAESFIAESRRLVDELSTMEPNGARERIGDYRVTAPLPVLMKLGDGLYGDAKRARSAADFSDIVNTLAETANVLGHARSDAAWRQRAWALRDEALRVAKSAADSDLQTRRAELKLVHARCDACHQSFRK